MLKLLIGVALSTLILGALVFMPYFINYSYMPNLWFGLNNLAFLMSGLVIGGLIYREFFTDEIPEPQNPKFKKAFKEINLPMARKTFENDSLGGKNHAH